MAPLRGENMSMTEAVADALSTLRSVSELMHAEDTARQIRLNPSTSDDNYLTQRVDRAIRLLRAAQATLNAASRELVFENMGGESNPTRSNILPPQPSLG